MEKISQFLMCNLKTYKIKNSKQILSDVLSVNVTGIDKLSLLIHYFNKYPLLARRGGACPRTSWGNPPVFFFSPQKNKGGGGLGIKNQDFKD